MREIREIDFKHNGSEVVGKQPWCARVFEDGEPILKVPERIMLDSRFSLDLRGFAGWAYCQSISWVFTVEDCCARLGLTRGKWRTLSTEGHAAGFIKQTKEWVSTAQGRQPSWCHLLKFNFTVFEVQAHTYGAVSPGQNLSTDVQKQPIAHTHVRERSKSTSRGSGQQQPVARLVENCRETPPMQYKQEIPPHAGACLGGGGEVKAVQESIQGQGLAAMLGIRGAQGLEVDKASRGATGQQLEAAASAFKVAMAAGSVRHSQALAVALARRAARGEVTTPRREAGPSPQQAAQVRLAAFAGGRLASPVPGGESWTVEVGGFVRDGHGALLHPDAAMELIAKLDVGELDLL